MEVVFVFFSFKHIIQLSSVIHMYLYENKGYENLKLIENQQLLFLSSLWYSIHQKIACLWQCNILQMIWWNIQNLYNGL